MAHRYSSPPPHHSSSSSQGPPPPPPPPPPPLCQPYSAPQGQAESGGMVHVAYAGPVCPAAALRDSVLCLPTDIHSLFVNKPSSRARSPCAAICVASRLLYLPPPPPPPRTLLLLVNTPSSSNVARQNSSSTPGLRGRARSPPLSSLRQL